MPSPPVAPPVSQRSQRPPSDPKRLKDALSCAVPYSRRAGRSQQAAGTGDLACQSPLPSTLSCQVSAPPAPQSPCLASGASPGTLRISRLPVNTLCFVLALLSHQRSSLSNPPHVESATCVAVFICLVLSEWKVREGWISFFLLVTLCPQRLKGAWHVIGSINICGRKERRENFKQ